MIFSTEKKEKKVIIKIVVIGVLSKNSQWAQVRPVSVVEDMNKAYWGHLIQELEIFRGLSARLYFSLPAEIQQSLSLEKGSVDGWDPNFSQL